MLFDNWHSPRKTWRLVRWRGCGVRDGCLGLRHTARNRAGDSPDRRRSLSRRAVDTSGRQVAPVASAARDDDAWTAHVPDGWWASNVRSMTRCSRRKFCARGGAWPHRITDRRRHWRCTVVIGASDGWRHRGTGWWCCPMGERVEGSPCRPLRTCFRDKPGILQSRGWRVAQRRENGRGRGNMIEWRGCRTTPNTRGTEVRQATSPLSAVAVPFTHKKWWGNFTIYNRRTKQLLWADVLPKVAAGRIIIDYD